MCVLTLWCGCVCVCVCFIFAFVCVFSFLSSPFPLQPDPHNLPRPIQSHMFDYGSFNKNRGASLRLISMVKGYSPGKRGRIFPHLQHLKTKTAFLQDTQLATENHHRHCGQIFHSNLGHKARGPVPIGKPLLK